MPCQGAWQAIAQSDREPGTTRAPYKKSRHMHCIMHYTLCHSWHRGVHTKCFGKASICGIDAADSGYPAPQFELHCSRCHLIECHIHESTCRLCTQYIAMAAAALVCAEVMQASCRLAVLQAGWYYLVGRPTWAAHGASHALPGIIPPSLHGTSMA